MCTVNISVKEVFMDHSRRFSIYLPIVVYTLYTRLVLPVSYLCVPKSIVMWACWLSRAQYNHVFTTVVYCDVYTHTQVSLFSRVLTYPPGELAPNVDKQV